MELVLLINKLKHITLGLFCVLLIGNPVYATEDFFWSDVEPMPDCGKTRDGSSQKVGLVTEDGKKLEWTLPTCEEAMKNRVLVLVNGKYLHTSAIATGAEPFIENGRTMIPLRATADAFGFEVEWEEREKKITLMKDSRTIILHIGEPEIIVDGKTVHFEGAVPMVKNNRTFLPAGKLAEILGIQVSWDKETRTATFTHE